MSIQDMTGGGLHHLRPGEWTDDTSLALCLAASLIERNGFYPGDQLHRFVRRMDEGYMSSTGKYFDIGNTTLRALKRFKESNIVLSGSIDPESAGNGSIMRLASIPMFFYPQFEVTIERCAESSMITHAHPEAVDACRFFGALIFGALSGENKEILLKPFFSPAVDYWNRNPLVKP